MLFAIEKCAECGVPHPFTHSHRWLPDGTIVQALNERARVAFLECEFIDPLFDLIGNIIGVPIDHIVVNITTRGCQLYMESVIPEEVRRNVRERTVEPPVVAMPIIDFCHMIGYGKYSFVGYRFEGNGDDFCTIRIYRPFSVYEAAGAFAGVIACLVGGEHSVSYTEVEPKLYEFTTHWTRYPEVLKERLKLPVHLPREGDVELPRCPSCGIPEAFSRYRWDLKNGIILNTTSGRRMALLGPGLLDSVFEALEWELGDTIPRSVVEAQRRNARAGLRFIDLTDFKGVRDQLALRGLGELKNYKAGKEGVYIKVANPALHLMLVGMVQGGYEKAYDIQSDVDWELSESGELTIEVKKRKVQVEVSKTLTFE
ncbi:MAG: hypothetical protein WHT46_06225 [Candidatus Geothermincolales bacterium]